MFFTEYNWAQKIFKKSINSEASKIVIDFNMVDEVQLISWNESDKIMVIGESETNTSPNIIIEEKNNVIYIKSTESYLEQNVLDIDKQCSIQPIYTSYQIKIPKNKKIDLTISQGNFNAINFEGDLNLKLESGIVKLNKFSGLVNLQINMGKVYISGLRNTKIDVSSNLGKVTSNLLIQDKSKNHIKGIFGKSNNALNIHAILANVQLKSVGD